MKGLLNLQLVNWSTIIFITFHFEGLNDYMSFQLKLRLSPQIWSLVVRMTCVFSSWVGKFLYFNRLFFKHLVYLFHFFTSLTLGLVLQQPLPSSFVLRWPSPSPSPITFSVVEPISDNLYHSHPICPPQFCSRWSFSILSIGRLQCCLNIQFWRFERFASHFPLTIFQKMLCLHWCRAMVEERTWVRTLQLHETQHNRLTPRSRLWLCCTHFRLAVISILNVHYFLRKNINCGRVLGIEVILGLLRKWS